MKLIAVSISLVLMACVPDLPDNPSIMFYKDPLAVGVNGKRIDLDLECGAKAPDGEPRISVSSTSGSSVVTITIADKLVATVDSENGVLKCADAPAGPAA